MKIKFQNLGSIKKAELDLRPLTVIIGPNNSNKTYIAYSIYGLWKHIQNFSISPFFANTQKELWVQVKKEREDVWSLNIDDFFCDIFNSCINDIVIKFKGSVLEIFFQDSSHKIFENTNFQVEVSEKGIKETFKNLSTQDFLDDLRYGYNSFLEAISLEISKVEYQNNQLLFYLTDGNIHRVDKSDMDEFNLYEIDIKKIFISTIFSLLKNKIFSEVLPSPAERNAFINTYKMLANRRYKLLKETQRGLFSISNKYRKNFTEKQLELLREQGDIRYPQPVEDFLDFLSDIELENNPDPDPKNKNEFQQLADQIEDHIQNRNKTKFKNTKFGGKEIKVSVKRGLEIDLYNASSSIKQLAPLLLYLRYRAKVGDFLVIDEPEMNLHPESQVKLLEALSILVNLGVRVLLTTHSPYIMAHLNNIVNGNHEDQEILENQAQSLYLQDSQAFLKMDQVSAYEIKENKLLSLHDPDYGIRWDTLSDVSVDVQQKFFAIYEAGQKNSETNETEEE
jgi:predicted ATPase